MRRLRPWFIASFAFLPTALGIVACSSPPEQLVLNQFFRAARLRDATALRGFATVTFDPNSQGTVGSFDIVNVSPEARKPLAIQSLVADEGAVKQEEAEFIKRKDAYQVANMEAITRVVRAEGRGEPIAKADAEVQAAWSKLREESAQLSRKLSDAQRKLAGESSIAKISLQGTQADPAKQGGEMVTKEVTIDASVRQPDGASVDKTLVVTMQRAVIAGSPEVAGKWVVTAIRDTAASPATKSS
jgi:hypothetical protein